MNKLWISLGLCLLLMGNGFAKEIIPGSGVDRSFLKEEFLLINDFISEFKSQGVDFRSTALYKKFTERFNSGILMPSDKYYLLIGAFGANDKGMSTGKLAVGYYQGFDKTLPINEIKAYKWFKVSAYQGNTYAQTHLCISKKNGFNTNIDYVEAYKWCNLALRGEQTSSEHTNQVKKIMQSLNLMMTSEQVAEAQRLTREFKIYNRPLIEVDKIR